MEFPSRGEIRLINRAVIKSDYINSFPRVFQMPNIAKISRLPSESRELNCDSRESRETRLKLLGEAGNQRSLVRRDRKSDPGVSYSHFWTLGSSVKVLSRAADATVRERASSSP